MLLSIGSLGASWDIHFVAVTWDTAHSLETLFSGGKSRGTEQRFVPSNLHHAFESSWEGAWLYRVWMKRRSISFLYFTENSVTNTKNNRNVFYHSCGGWKSEICRAVLSLGLWWAFVYWFFQLLEPAGIPWLVAVTHLCPVASLLLCWSYYEVCWWHSGHIQVTQDDLHISRSLT